MKLELILILVFQPSLLSNTDEIQGVKDAFLNKQGIKDFQKLFIPYPAIF